MTINKTKPDQISISADEITIRSGAMEPVVIRRTDLRTRLELIDWVYRLTGWPGMTPQALRAFIAAVFAEHGWTLASDEDNSPAIEPSRGANSASPLITAGA